MNNVERCKFFLETSVNQALDLLPEKMRSDKAKVMLLAIGLQESRLVHRKQIGGPAKSYLQFELGGGVKGVMNHKAVKSITEDVCSKVSVPFGGMYIHNAMEFNDVLAFALGRLLLYTDPKSLPEIGDAQGAWDFYQRVWRPGKPHRDTWDSLYSDAVEAVKS